MKIAVLICVAVVLLIHAGCAGSDSPAGQRQRVFKKQLSQVFSSKCI